MRDVLAVAKALADENRLRALAALRGGELCVCQLIELLGLAASTVSKHMSVLKGAGLVEGRKEGRWVHYRLAGEGATAAARDAVGWACRHLARDPRVRADARALARIRKTDKQACRDRLEREQPCR